MQLLERFGRVWCPSFLTRFLAAQKTRGQAGRSWGFWFLASTLVALLATTILVLRISPALQTVITKLQTDWAKVPAFTAEIKDGHLTTDLPQPFTLSVLDSQFTVAVDTTEKQYKKGEALQLSPGVYFFDTLAFAKEPNGKLNTLEYTKILKPLSFSKNSLETGIKKIAPTAKTLAIVALGLFLWFYIALFRLLAAVVWSGLLWLIARLSGHRLGYGTAYLAVLNLALVPATFDLILLASGHPFAFSGTLVIVLVAAANVWWLKTRGKKAA